MWGVDKRGRLEFEYSEGGMGGGGGGKVGVGFEWVGGMV